MAKPVLLLGATGLFGGHLAWQLARRSDISLVIAGRREGPLQALAAELGAQALRFDRIDLPHVRDRLQSLRPFAVIDCSGPFQYYGDAPYGFAEAVLETDAHYLDIADGTEFVAGISVLDGLAKAQGVCAWSGASTTPALSSAIAADLVDGLSEVDLIETSILPGNKTPRGLSVMRAILGQVGARFMRHYGGRAEATYGWQDTIWIAPSVGGQAITPRRAALVDTPDGALLPDAFKAHTVIARAGLELGLFHSFLSVVAWARRYLKLRSIEPLACPLLRLSTLFSGFGSNEGGMRVRVVGLSNGQTVERVWDLIIPDGNGPKTPIQPAVILLDRLLAGDAVPGARPAVEAFTRVQAEDQLREIHARFERRERVLRPIFEQNLGAAFSDLPQPVKDLHSPRAVVRHHGAAQIETAKTLLGKMAALAGGFPLKGGEVPAEVTIEAREACEVWTRKMGHKTFRSTLSLQPGGQMTETFGPMVFELDLAVKDACLKFPVGRGRAFGFLPIPKSLTPISETSEGVDAQGRFTFDVRLSLPNGALIVHYKGYLEPQ